MKAYERLLRYATFPTVSDENCETCPSTPAQLDFGRVLVEELLSLGVTDARMDEHDYVSGKQKTALSPVGRARSSALSLIWTCRTPCPVRRRGRAWCTLTVRLLRWKTAICCRPSNTPR